MKNKFKDYRILSPGTVLKTGDQWYDPVTMGWINTGAVGETLDHLEAYRYRRPIKHRKPVQKYRTLKIGDVVQEGDEISFFEDDHWIKCRTTIGNKLNKYHCATYRRPI